MPITQSTKQILGYVVGKPNLNLDDLRRYLKAKLPSYMVPAVVIRLETLPLLPNGKLDTKSLPEPKESTVRDEDDFVAPKSEREQQLVRIWEEVLNVSPVGIHDNFFEIGGDSILSIQVITRVRKAGLKLSATQLFEHQTIAELALFVKLANEVKDHEVVVTGPAILTPIQQWFFEVHQASPHHWNHIISFELPTDINTDVISRGIRHLIERHDALRLVFLKNNGNWIGEVNAPKDIAGFQLIDLSDLSPEIQSTAVSERIAEIQAKTKLAEGGLFQGIYFDCGTDQKHRLILLAHHLIIDTVSWSILIEELSSVVQSLKLGQTISLPPTTTAFAKWGAQLDQYAKSESLNSQIGFWEAQTQVPEILPSDFEVSFPIAESSITIFPHEMSEEQTELMLTEALKAYSTRPDEMLITALMLALADWKGISELCLGLERHGREVIDESLDLSNSVGWFTAFFPIKLNIERSADIGTILKTVKEQLRQPLQGGIGYGVLRYLSGNKKLDQQPRVLFNYLGNQHGFDSPIFGRGEFIGQDSRDPQNERYYQLEVNAYVTDGKLQTRWSYCRDQFKVDNIKHLVTCFNSALQSLNRHCTEIESGGYTPSDFPEADLSQSDLDNLFDQL